MRDADLTETRGAADVGASKPVDVVDDAFGCHCRSAAHAFFGRLEENLDSAAELLTVFREPAGGGKAHGRMTVMTAGMHHARIFAAV